MCVHERARMVGGVGGGHKWQNVKKNDRVGGETLLYVPLPALAGVSLLLCGRARKHCSGVCMCV